ncbi:MAG TPA: acyl-homoserine-lactone synthase [Bosea sp. (in: a-proteobacteria)]|nr:acyl-homoserine-lactone synthase [Bosea sp. (in: a-proteobacteria)]
MLMVIPGSDISRHAGLMDRVFRFRHSIFAEEKAWTDLRRPDGLERDQFDDENAIHQICLRDDEIVGYQRLLPTTRPHLLSEVLSDLCREQPPTGPRVFEWTRFCVAPGWRDLRPRPGGPFLELTQGVVEWGLAQQVDTVTVVIDWRLMVIAMQLRFFVRPLGFPKKIGRDEVVALRMSFNRETLETIHQARGSESSVLSGTPLSTAA